MTSAINSAISYEEGLRETGALLAFSLSTILHE